MEIIYENSDFLVINKACGEAVQSQENNDIIKDYNTLHGISLFPITRIDQSVSGLVLMAYTAEIANQLSTLLIQGKINKKYLAVVEGFPLPDAQNITHLLIKKGLKSYIDPKGKISHLSLETIHKYDRYSLLCIQITTGRFHQIRCQLSAIGHPIKGDIKYGSKRTNKEGGIYLHSHYLSFEWKGEWYVFEAPPPLNKPLYNAFEKGENV